MKRSLTSLFASALVSFALASGSGSSALAQSDTAVRANIPFAFQAGSGKVLPAGTYTFSKQGANLLAIKGTAHGAYAMTVVLADNDVPTSHASIVFMRYGDRVFLHKIASPGSSYDCAMSRQEKQIVRELKTQTATQLAINVEPALPR